MLEVYQYGIFGNYRYLILMYANETDINTQADILLNHLAW